MIARRNDRHRDVDNGTRATVTAIDNESGALTETPDAGGRRVLDADYAAEHLEHAYALTGHGAQGATVEWAGVIGRPSDFTAEWAYPALSRPRGQTRLHVIAEPAAHQAERQDYAPLEPVATLDEALQATRQAMRRRAAEPLALQQITPEQLPAIRSDAMRCLPLNEIAEAGAERAATAPPPEPDWLALARRRDAIGRGRTLGR